MIKCLNAFKSKRSETYIITVLQYLLLFAAIVLILSLIAVGVNGVKMHVMLDDVVEAVAESSSYKDEATQAAIEKWCDEYNFTITIEADEWHDKAAGEIAYGSTFTVYVSYTESFAAWTGVSFDFPVEISQQGVARHRWGTRNGG